VISRRSVLQGFAAGTVLLGISACSSNKAGSGANAGGGTLTLGAGVEPLSFDPAQSREAQFVQYFQPVFDTLIRRMTDGQPGPMLAKSWSYNADNTELTFVLRDDVKFSDGEAFNATAAKANLDRFKTAGGPLQAQLASLDSVTAKDATTLVLKLSTQDPSLIVNLGGPSGYMQSPKQFTSATINTQPVGSGPYTLDRSKTTPGAQYTFVKSANYWNKDLQQFATIVIKPMKDENARINALRSGQIDGMIATAKTVAEAKKSKITVLEYPGDWQGLTFFDRAGTLAPALKDPRVRQAINYAIDKATILDKVGLGLGEVTSQIFSPKSSAYVKDLDSAYGFDIAKAKSLLAEAGYANGFTLTMPSSSSMDPAIAPVLRDGLAQVGIKVDWVDVPAASFQADQQSGKYPAVFAGFGQPAVGWGAVTQVIAPNAAWNVLKSTDPKVDALLGKIKLAADDAAGPEYQELNQYLVDQAWFAPFFRVTQPYYTSAKVAVVAQTGQAVPSIYNFTPAK
jgi:peptide/nickel transport system substrate-binding protein